MTSGMDEDPVFYSCSRIQRCMDKMDICLRFYFILCVHVGVCLCVHI